MKFLVIIIIAAAGYFGYQKYTSYQQAKIEEQKEAARKEAAAKEAQKKAQEEAAQKKALEAEKFVLEPENIYTLFQKNTDPMVSLFKEENGTRYISDCYNKITDTQEFDKETALLAINHYKEDLAKFCTLKSYKYFRMPPLKSVNTPLYYFNTYKSGIKLMLIATEYLFHNYKYEEGLILLKETLIMQNKFRYPAGVVALYAMNELDVACVNTIKRLLKNQILAKEDAAKLKDLLPSKADYALAVKRALNSDLQLFLLGKKIKGHEFARLLKNIPDEEFKSYFEKYQVAFCKSVEEGKPAFPKLSDTKYQNFFRKNIYFNNFIKKCKVPEI